MLEATYPDTNSEFTHCGQGSEEETMRIAKYFYDNPTATYESGSRALGNHSTFGVWFRLQCCLPEIHPRVYETIKDNLADLGIDITVYPKRKRCVDMTARVETDEALTYLCNRGYMF